MGEVSGNICCRDFDDEKSFKEFLNHHSLAQTLPISRTQRGGHVFFRTKPEHASEMRARLGKPNGTGAIDINFEGVHQGELRVGVGCYSTVPPSPHDTGKYEWIRPLPASLYDLPEVDLITDEILPFYCFPTLHRDTHTSNTSHSGWEGECPAGLAELLEELKVGPLSLEKALQRTVPTVVGTRNTKIFELARELKAFPSLASHTALALMPILDRWYRWYEMSAPVMQKAKHPMPYDEAFGRFVQAWRNVLHAKGCEEINQARAEAFQGDEPTCAASCRSKEAKWLVRLCAELQRRSGRNPFYLDCRTAGKVIGLSHVAANALLWTLRELKILEVVKPHDYGKHRATEYRYLGDIPERNTACAGRP